jgi:hypothetical protein
MSDNNCHECGEHCIDCICDKDEKCSKCDKIRMKWDILCFECTINSAKKLINRSKELIKKVDDERGI